MRFIYVLKVNVLLSFVLYRRRIFIIILRTYLLYAIYTRTSMPEQASIELTTLTKAEEKDNLWLGGGRYFVMGDTGTLVALFYLEARFQMS